MICFLSLHEISSPDLHFVNISCFNGLIKTYTQKKQQNYEESEKTSVKNGKCQAEACLCHS